MEDIVLNAKFALDCVCIYRNLLEDDVISKFRELLNYISKSQVELDEAINIYNEFFFRFAKSGSISLEEYMLDKIIYDENPFSYSGNNEEAASNDLDNLQLVTKISSRVIKNKLVQIFSNSEHKYIIEKLPEWISKIEVKDEVLCLGNFQRIKEIVTSSIYWSESMKAIFKFHKDNGCGFSANNVLLYGDRGTGKSSTVKAILNEYYAEGLRMIEIPKAYLTDFPAIIRDLKNRPQKFIIFIDDLVFGDEEESYTALKAILEGGLESKTSNIVIYATSNRRHLIKEYFSERKGLLSKDINDEVRAHDSIEEKLSLSDRFGISVIFSSPDQNRYLAIVEGLAEKRSLKISKENLHKEALKWAIWYNGRSARTARQFIDWIEGDLSTRQTT